ncbi:MAG: NADPH-dependent 2,4-dienoyl-CoA reductase, partial [Chloroflexi bacterium]|nr:NADPH-dependent 2,4-dienoyl-CoA reductase [Chloroflexota bacterium]
MTANHSPASPYPHLLSPLVLGNVRLKNRVIMGSMHTRLEHMDQPIARQAAFYAERARGEVGMIITGGYSPNQEGRLEDGAPILDGSEQVAAHKPIVQAVHDAGAKFLLQIL